MIAAVPEPAVPRTPQALALRPAPRRLQILRLITFAVVVGPMLGTAALVALWLWEGVETASLWALGIAYCLGTLGVTIGFHRGFAHRSYETSRPLQIALVILGSMSLQGSLLYWVATHRRHHRFSDTPDDPHSPHFHRSKRLGAGAGLWHGHMGWMFEPEITNAIRFAPDIIRDRTVFKVQSRYGLWALLGLAAPPAIAALFTRDPMVLLQIFLAAGPMRIFLVHHASWAVGSLSHMAGARPFETHDRSANNFWVALFAFGEGLQNNHHAFPRAAYHSFRWYEPDATGLVLRAMERLGLIWNVYRPSPDAVSARRRKGDGSKDRGK